MASKVYFLLYTFGVVSYSMTPENSFQGKVEFLPSFLVVKVIQVALAALWQR